MDGVTELWEAYVETVDNPSWVISLEMARYLERFVREERPLSALDLGAGLSSLLLRKLGVQVILTVDPDEEWLERTRRLSPAPKGGWILERNLSPGILYDLVLVDIGPLGSRNKWIRGIDNYVAKTAIIDDADRGREGQACLDFVESHPGWDLTLPIKETIDNCGRFAARIDRRK